MKLSGNKKGRKKLLNLMEELAGDYGKSFSSLQTDYCVFMPDSFGITNYL